MIANSLFVYFAVIIQLYLFLCYKMNDFNSKVMRNSITKVSMVTVPFLTINPNVIQDFVWSGSILLVLIQIFKVICSQLLVGENQNKQYITSARTDLSDNEFQVWELFLVRSHIPDALYPVATIEPVLTLTSLLLALIFIHTCFR